MSIYERLCRFGSRLPLLPRLAQRREHRELERAARFLSPILEITPMGVISFAYFVAISVMLCSILLAWTLSLNLMLFIPLSIAIAVLSYYVFYSYPINRMNSYRLTLSEESDLIYEQFILTFQSGGTIFDAIKFIARSGHPYLSRVFQDILSKAYRGIPPEESIAEFSRNQPSDDLRRYFTIILSSLERKTDLLDELSGESFEADLSLRAKNLELESRLLVIAALVTYIPILLTLAISLTGNAGNLSVLLLVPLLVALTHVFRVRFAANFSAYFDRPAESGFSQVTQSDIMEEYEAFLNFLIILGERLSSGDTLEVAIISLYNDCEPEIQRLLDPTINAITWESKSIGKAMELAASKALGQRVGAMMRMIPEMCELSATGAGERITKIATRLIQRSAIAKERESIIIAQKLKVYLLSFTSSLVLGLLCSLSPYLYIGAFLSEGGSFVPGSATLMDFLPLVISLMIITTSSGYHNTLMVNGKRPILIGFLCGLLFWLSLVISLGITGTGLV